MNEQQLRKMIRNIINEDLKNPGSNLDTYIAQRDKLYDVSDLLSDVVRRIKPISSSTYKQLSSIYTDLNRAIMHMESEVSSNMSTEVNEVSGYTLKDSDKKAIKMFLHDEEFDETKYRKSTYELYEKPNGVLLKIPGGAPIAFWTNDRKLFIQSTAYGNVSQTHINYAKKMAQGVYKEKDLANM